MLTAVEFRAMHRPGDPFVLPNAWDLASARWLHAAGHPVLGTTSLGVAVAAGLPDGAGVAAAETLDLAIRLAAADIPVTVDLEAGFSDDPEEVGSFAARLARLGVVGVNIEDSAPDGRLVDPELAAAKSPRSRRPRPGSTSMPARIRSGWAPATDCPSATPSRSVVPAGTSPPARAASSCPARSPSTRSPPSPGPSPPQ
jgi:hypothetical protein